MCPIFPLSCITSKGKKEYWSLLEFLLKNRAQILIDTSMVVNYTFPRSYRFVARNIAPLADKSFSFSLNGSDLEQMSNKGWKTSPRTCRHLE